MNLQSYLPQRVARLAALMNEAASGIYSARFGLSRDEWRVLAAAGEVRSQPTRSVATLTGLDKVAISRAASALETRRLITRTEDRADRRIKIIHLTSKGATLLDAVQREMEARDAELTDGLSPEALAAFETVLAELTQRASSLGEQAAGHQAGTVGPAHVPTQRADRPGGEGAAMFCAR